MKQINIHIEAGSRERRKIATDRETEVVWKWIWPVMLNSVDKDPRNKNYKNVVFWKKITLIDVQRWYCLGTYLSHSGDY